MHLEVLVSQALHKRSRRRCDRPGEDIREFLLRTVITFIRVVARHAWIVPPEVSKLVEADDRTFFPRELIGELQEDAVPKPQQAAAPGLRQRNHANHDTLALRDPHQVIPDAWPAQLRVSGG